jgi:hypothetical protein
LPDVSNCLRGIAHASDRQATLHGVVFDILGPRVVTVRAPLFREGDVAGEISDGRRRKVRKRVWNYLLEPMNSRAIRSAVIVRERLTIQYSEALVMRGRGRGVLDTRFRG